MRNSLLQIKSFLFITSFLAIATIANAQDRPFITVWQTDNPGTSEDNQITIPGTGTNYTIEWEEVGNETNNNGSETGTNEHTVTFPSAGTYRVKISGDFNRINFFNDLDKAKIIDVSQWGRINWENFERAFFGCINLGISATDAPDLSKVESLVSMFAGAESVDSDFNNWELTNVINLSNMFAGASSFNGDISSWDVSNVVDMSNMFFEAYAFNGDLSSWNVSNVLNMRFFFAYAYEFNSDLSKWDVSNVTDMDYMFKAASLFNSDISFWNVSNVTSMAEMFRGASFFNTDISGWNVSSVTDMSSMFYEANSFNVDISAWDVSAVTSMSQMFYGNTAFNQDLGIWDIRNVRSMDRMLSLSALDKINYDQTLTGWSQQSNIQGNVSLGAKDLKYCDGSSARKKLITDKKWVINGDVPECQPEFITIWKSSNSGGSNNNQITLPFVGDNYFIDWVELDNPENNDSEIGSGFHTITFPTDGTYQIKVSGDIKGINFSFSEDNLKILEVNNWGSIQWESLNNAFYGTENLQITANDIPDLSRVTDMSYMFYGASSFNAYVNNWNVSRIRNMSDLFHGASAFNQDLSTWDVNNVTKMSRMFASTTAFDQDLTDWNTANVKDMDFMFWDADSFQGDISSWDVSNVNNMWGMFYSADSVNSDISNWDVSSVTNMTEMFREAKTFNQDISTWNTAKVTDISGMFYEATSFDQDLGDWDLSNAGSLFEFLTNAGLSAQNYDASLEGWATNGTIPRDIALSAEGLAYCASEEYRQQLIDDFGWGIIGDIQCSLVLEETFPAAEATHVEKNTEIYLTFDQTFEEIDFGNIELSDVSGNAVTINSVVADSLTLRIIHNGLNFNTYEVTIPENTLMSASGKVNDEIKWSFATQSILAAKDKQLATNLTNYPNPFSDYTTLSFSLTEGNSFDLLVYDVKGQLVRQESFDNRDSGEQSIKFERKGLPTGLYHYQIQAAQGAVSGKMMIK